ncbi:MAG TPA: hypothetical protein VFV50_07390 [Bdellovibrionales bacterium]|nr:hypothetical protein [Bdellovibrionales bacterium]
MLRDLRKNWRRITRAAIFSAIGAASSWVWYQHGQKDSERKSKDPIAVLVRAVNEVERKPASRVVWEDIAELEALYPGEAVRTTDVSEASIKFLKGGTQIELEPGSLVVLEEGSGGAALNFITGSLFVSDKGDAAAETIQINSGSKSIKVEELKKGGEAISAGQGPAKSALKVIAPTAYKAVYLNPLGDESMAFEFEKLDDTYQVRLETGATPKKLTPLASATAAGTAGTIKAPMKVGPFYWRLVAVSNDPSKPERVSRVQKNEVIAKIPPKLLAPEKGKSVVWSPKEPSVGFRWANQARLENMVFELSKSPDLKNPIVNENVLDRTSYAIELADAGTYHWRVRGQIRGSQEQLVSPVSSFNFKREVELLPPVLVRPAQNEGFSQESLQNTKIVFKWEEADGVETYRISIKGPGKDITETTNIPEFRVSGFEPGSYAWTVTSIAKDGKASAAASERKFSVNKLPRLQWADGKESPFNHQYATETPSLKIEWQKGPPQAKSWRARIIEDGRVPADSKWSEPLAQPALSGEVPKAGKYEVEVEALDEKGEVVARSGRRLVNVQMLPLLPAPEFAETVPEELMARNNGNLELAWKPVNRAAKYVVEIKKQDGTMLKEVTSEQTKELLKSLMPGQYKVVLKSVDQTGRRGPASEERPLLVPDRSDARAPKIRAIKVK